MQSRARSGKTANYTITNRQQKTLATEGGFWCSTKEDFQKMQWEAHEVAKVLALREGERREKKEEEGAWPHEDPRRAFVEGAAWWEWHQTGATMWGLDRNEAEQEADRRYPKEISENGKVKMGENIKRPTIVTLCGSTKFKDAFARALFTETMAGRIVLTIGSAMHSDPELFAQYDSDELEKIKKKLDALHMRKIDLSDEILVLNVGHYVGESTSREIAYAYITNKTIRWLVAHGRDDMSAREHYEKWKDHPDFIALAYPDRPRTCPYEGCENPYTKTPPCALCYE